MKRGKRLLIFGGAVVLVFVAAIVAHWQYYVYLTNAELARIRAAGYPMTLAEVEERYRIASDDFQGQDDWLAAFAERRKAAQTDQRPLGIPFCSDTWGDEPAVQPVVGQPWPDRAISEKYLAQYAHSLSLLAKAASQGGKVSVSIRAALHPDMENREEHQTDILYFCRLLGLSSLVHAHQDRPELVIDDLLTLLALARCLDIAPTPESLSTRYFSDSEAFDRTMEMIAIVPFSDEELRLLQDAVNEIRYQEHFRIAMLAAGAHQIEHLDDDFGYGFYSVQFWRGIRLFSPKSRYVYLSNLRAIESTLQSGLPELRRQIISREATLEGKGRVPLLKWSLLRAENERLRYGNARSFINVIVAMTTRCRAAMTAISVVRYRQMNGRLPKSLDQLTPQFLAAVPFDPVDGQPLRYRAETNGFVIYGVGHNEIDDGGSTTGLERGQDIGYRVSLKERP